MDIRLADPADQRREYDAVVVGSGFGAAFAALPLVHAGARVLMLERGPWVERAARPGGRPILWREHVLRFAQCDRPVYGVSVRAFEVTELSPSGYAERPAGPDPLLTGSGVDWNAGGMRHLDPLVDAGSVLVAVDGWRRVG
jgi:choline dehydrogenase-like flavoprotein